MLKPLQTEFKGRTITLECTHKRAFPPPQMYGSTPEDIDNLWRQGRVDQGQYQHLTTWREACGLMIMGPKCLDCPLALKQNPRPGRPHVIETESWLDVKEKIHWEDMKDTKRTATPEVPAASSKAGFVKRGAPVPATIAEPEPSLAEALSQGNTTESADKALMEEPPVDVSSKKKRSAKRRSKKKDTEVVDAPVAVPSSTGVPSESPVTANTAKLEISLTDEAEAPTPTSDKTSQEVDPGSLDDNFLDALADD